MNENKFSQKQFLFYGINFIVGFGFITTISSIITHGLWGILFFALAILISLGVMLCFANLATQFPNNNGGSYYWAKKTNIKFFAFFQGWNQFIQGPIGSATAPLFLSSTINIFIENNEIAQLSISIVSICLFLFLSFISTLGIKINKKIIFATGIIKWVILFLGLFISLYLAFIDNAYSSNFDNSKTISVFIIVSNTLSFIYAFGGVEDLGAMVEETETKNFKKTLMIIFGFIISFYFVFYIILNGISNISNMKNFSEIFNRIFSITGIVIFALGTLFNGISSNLSNTISTLRKIVPLAEDGYFPKSLAKKNKKNEYKNAIIFRVSWIMLSMLIFWLIPLLLNLSDFFLSVVQMTTISILMQYLLTIISSFILLYQRKIKKINIWELVSYAISLILILFILIVFIFPPIAGQKWTIKSTIILCSYFGSIAIGFSIYGINYILNNKKQNNIKT